MSKQSNRSPGRQTIRIMIWTALVTVGLLRLIIPTERAQPFRFGNADHGVRYRWSFNNGRTPVSEVPPDLWRIHIEIGPEDADRLRSYRWNGWHGKQERPQVLCTVREGGTVYTNVAVHLKGSAGSFRPFDDKPALTLNFSKYADDQEFHGYKKISLNNSVQDPSFICEALCRELFEEAGVPAPRANHATVIINGRDLGLYVMTEGWGKPFLRRYFKNVSGNLYDGGFLQDVTGEITVNSGDDREDRSDIQRLVEAALADPKVRWERLNEVLDVERFTTFVALELMTCHWDGYCQNRNNYRLFHNRETGRMVFLPHGMDQMFGAGRSSPNDTIEPYAASRGLVARAFTSTPQGRRMILDRIAELRNTIFTEERLTNRVHELARRIRPTLEAYGSGDARQHDAQVAYLCTRISERVRSISDQLARPRDPIAFDDDGVARLSGWEPRVTAQPRSRPRFEKVASDNAQALRIRLGHGGGSASWRVRVPLEMGRYRFEGRARTLGVSRAGGVCLRISGTRNEWVSHPEDQWFPLAFDLTIEEPLGEVELVCELGGATGEAWFDEASLRLVRQ